VICCDATVSAIFLEFHLGLGVRIDPLIDHYSFPPLVVLVAHLLYVDFSVGRFGFSGWELANLAVGEISPEDGGGGERG